MTGQRNCDFAIYKKIKYNKNIQPCAYILILQAYSPEIFILPGTHDAVARPVENAANTIIQTHGLTTGA